MLAPLQAASCTHHDFKGEATGALKEKKVKLWDEGMDVNGVRFWTLSVFGGAVGGGDGEDYDEMKGGCGEYKTVQPKIDLGIPPFAFPIVFSIFNLKEIDGTLTGAIIPLPLAPFTTESVTLKLTRR